MYLKRFSFIIFLLSSFFLLFLFFSTPKTVYAGHTCPTTNSYCDGTSTCNDLCDPYGHACGTVCNSCGVVCSTPPPLGQCSTDADCPPPTQGGNYCCGSSVCNNKTTYRCGVDSVCTTNTFEVAHYDNCAYGCSNNACNPAPAPTCDSRNGQQCGAYGCCSSGNVESECYNVYDCSGNCVYGGIRNEGAYCGNGACSCNETSSSCPADCGSPTCDVSQCSSWVNGSCGAGGCASSQRQQTRTCPGGSTCSTSQCINDSSCGGSGYCGDNLCNNGETCSSCSGDCGACTGVSCNTDVNLAVSPNPANVNSTVNFSVVSGDASTFLGDSWTGGVSGCGGAWNSINCTGSASGTFQWSHTWKHCEGSFDNCSSTCSKSINFTINAIIPPAPTVSAPSCIDNGYSGSGVAISWTNTSPPVTYVDISTDINFGSYANKAVSGTSTSAPAGFSNSLTLNPGTTYYVRTWNGSQHSSTASFSIPVCPPAAPTGLIASCSITGTSVTFSWTPVTGATTYQITVNGTPVILNPYPISPDTNYLWGVKACNSTGCSSESPGSFTCASAVSPWIQTSGDVHSNEGINAPGGP